MPSLVSILKVNDVNAALNRIEADWPDRINGSNPVELLATMIRSFKRSTSFEGIPCEKTPMGRAHKRRWERVNA